MRWLFVRICCPMVLFAATLCGAQPSARIDVDLSARQGAFPPIYSWFGYDESNYTTTRNGQALLGELHDLSPVPVHVRAHFLLATGDGKAELKWSSSNVYTEDAAGNPVYSWTVLDQIFDAYARAGVRPMVELGFMPEALSSHPQPYHIAWPTKPGEVEGWSFPPKSYERWGELAYRVADHMVKRYGREAVAGWYWEVWNEPDIFYWHGTEPEYEKLYDYAVAGVRRAIPDARVGGPATTGPGARGKAADFLEAFLKHVSAGKSAATGGRVPLDFISFHVKGSPTVVDGHVVMGLDHELNNAANGFRIVSEFPDLKKLPVILSEADPEGCAACSAKQHPENGYRNGPLYPCYTAAAMKALMELAGRDGVNLISMLTWAFEFEDQPYFQGFRTLATNGVDKPVLNVFRMAGLMSGERVKTESSASVGLDAMLKSGVRAQPDVDAMATSDARAAAVMVWNYHDADVPAPGAEVALAVKHFPEGVTRVLVEHYRIDATHSNAYTVWKRMGSPQSPTAEQYAQLRAAGGLELDGPPCWMDVKQRAAELDFALPRQGVSLVRFTW
jgi:xylan 1,4-beta-xylosidase